MITPKEAFDAIKVLWPGTITITKSERSDLVRVLSADEEPYRKALGDWIDWGNTSAYPAPEPKWRDAKPEDLRYPFRVARFRDLSDEPWLTHKLHGITDTKFRAWPYLAGNGSFYSLCQVVDE